MFRERFVGGNVIARKIFPPLELRKNGARGIGCRCSNSLPGNRSAAGDGGAYKDIRTVRHLVIDFPAGSFGFDCGL